MKKNLNIEPVHIKYKKEIGKVKTNPVFEILTTGGLYMEILGKGAGFEVIGTGPHRGVARYIAEQRQPGIEWNDFAKSEHFDSAEILAQAPKYQYMTDVVIAYVRKWRAQRD